MSTLGMIDHKAEQAQRQVKADKHCARYFAEPFRHHLLQAKRTLAPPVEWWPVVTVLVAYALTIWPLPEIHFWWAP